MAAIVSSLSRYGLTIEAHCRNQSNKSKLELPISYFHVNSHLKELNISNKKEHFSYKGGCGMMHIKEFKRIIGLNYIK